MNASKTKIKLTNPAPAAIAPPIKIHFKFELLSGGSDEDEDESALLVATTGGFGGHGSALLSLRASC